MPKKKKRKKKTQDLKPKEIKEYVFQFLARKPLGTFGMYKSEGLPVIGCTTFHSYKKQYFENQRIAEAKLKLDLDGDLENEELKEIDPKNDEIEFLKWKIYGLERGWFSKNV